MCLFNLSDSFTRVVPYDVDGYCNALSEVAGPGPLGHLPIQRLAEVHVGAKAGSARHVGPGHDQSRGEFCCLLVL